LALAGTESLHRRARVGNPAAAGVGDFAGRCQGTRRNSNTEGCRDGLPNAKLQHPAHATRHGAAAGAGVAVSGGDGLTWRPHPLVDQRPGPVEDRLLAANHGRFVAWQPGNLDLSVHVAPDHRHYLIVLGGVAVFKTFLAADLPSLLTILPPLVAMAKVAAELDRRDEEVEAEMERLRREGGGRERRRP
jgi:hypothetical protein